MKVLVFRMKKIEFTEVHKRLHQTIDSAKHAAENYRMRADASKHQYERFLDDVANPICRMLGQALRAEGYPFQVFSPAGGLRLVSEKSGEDFVELFLHTGDELELSVVIGRVSRTWGRRVVINEQPIREGAAIDQLTNEDVLDFMLKQIEPFVCR